MEYNMGPIPSSITLSPKIANLTAGGEDLVLSSEIAPEDAVTSLEWTSSDETVATVAPWYSTVALVTPFSAGITTITVRTTSGDCTDTCTVTVIGLSSSGYVIEISSTGATYTILDIVSEEITTYQSTSLSADKLYYYRIYKSSGVNISNYSCTSATTAAIGDLILSFDSRGGSGHMVSIFIGFGETITLPFVTFEGPGAPSFDYWSTSIGGGFAYADGDSFTMGSGNVTLYANWVAN